MNNKQVLVVPADSINFYNEFNNGWAEFSDNELRLTHLLESALFMNRDEAETNENFKQIIPYCILKNWKTKQYFVYQRNKKGGETRLHLKNSLGIGGHLEPIDSKSDKLDGNKLYFDGMCRELKEEIGLTAQSFAGQTLGFIYDNSNEVGRVHLGVVSLIQPLSALFQVFPEDTMVNCSYKHVDELVPIIDSFENWSQIILKNKVLQ